MTGPPTLTQIWTNNKSMH